MRASEGAEVQARYRAGSSLPGIRTGLARTRRPAKAVFARASWAIGARRARLCAIAVLRLEEPRLAWVDAGIALLALRAEVAVRERAVAEVATVELGKGIAQP